MMKQESLAAFLVGTLSVCAVAGLVLSANYWFSTRTLRRLQPQAMACQTRLNLAQALLNDTLEYSKRNPSIDPLLQSLNIKTVVGPSPAATNSAGK